MKWSAFKSAVIASLLASSQTALSAAAEGEGPFGFVMGSDVAEYDCLLLTGGKYTCAAPKAHSNFETYIVQATSEQGICWIKGVGRDVSDTGHGLGLKQKTDGIASQIRSVYGSPTGRDDFLLATSIWDEFDDWMMAVAVGDRYYRHNWTNVGIRGVDDITVAALAKSSQTGYVIVEFSSESYGACQANQDAEDSSVF